MQPAHATSESAPRREPTLLVRAPMVPVAAALIVGILAGRYLPLERATWAAAGLLALAVAGAAALRPAWRPAVAGAVALAILSAGALRCRSLWEDLPGNHIVRYVPHGAQLSTVRGEIVTVPHTASPPGSAHRTYRPPQTVFLLEASRILTRDGWRPAEGLLRVTVYEPAERLRAGMRVELLCRMGRYGGAKNPGQFDWAHYSRLRGQRTWASVPSAAGVRVLAEADATGAWAGLLGRLRRGARESLQTGEEGQGRHLLAAVVIGERDTSLRRLNEILRGLGAAHLLSISGLHVGIFLGFAYVLCRLAMLGPRQSAIAMLVVLAAFLAVAEWRPPLLRAAVMAAAMCGGLALSRRSNPLNALALAAVVLLAADPLSLFTAGLQLSFAIVAGVLVGAGPLRRRLFARWDRRRGLMVFRREERFRRWLYGRGAAAATGAVSVSLAAWLLAAPLVAYHFGHFSPLAAPMSLLLLPGLWAVLVPGYLALGLAAAMPNLSWQFARLAERAAGVLAEVVSALEGVSALHLPMRTPPVVWVLGCYAVLAMLLWHRRLPAGRLLTLAAAVLLAAGTAWTQRPASNPPAAELHLLAVGSGQCALLRTPDGRTTLLDAGTLDDEDLAGEVLEPFLREMGLPGPSRAVISHENLDHYGALAAIARRYRLERVYLNTDFGRGRDVPQAVTELMASLAEAGTEIVRLRQGDTVALGGATEMEVLWPPEPIPAGLTVNDTSLVLRVRCGGRSVLLPGDLDETGQATLIERPGALRCDAMVLPHHGGWERCLPEFVAAARARTLLVSSGRWPRPPAGASVAAEDFYRSLQGPHCRGTNRDGWIRLRFGESILDVKTMRDGRR